MTPHEIANAPWASDEWREALISLVFDALTVAPQSTAQLFSSLGISADRELTSKLRSRLHSIKASSLSRHWRYSGKTGRFKDGAGNKVKLVEWGRFINGEKT